MILLESRTTHIEGDETLTSCGNEANSTDLVLSEEIVLNTSKTIVDSRSITFKDGFHVKATVGKSASFSISENNAELITSNTYDDFRAPRCS
ncbi:hypothetical protein [Tenacibaculum finnmarkense]|uniref:hypothetical protein n=1 Tax=Tenacibaculum finnmarkense TaxID=2781243 RepID=UPI001E364327|nr:hypothetical protein [Tenacibaculum finnmarkense]MCD8412718.1 hypothetical protein [Tenacibaculum finnmarkense genomovar ulcerans]MCG8207830.1 hypothetical protein [Tenacibaculum finnmarkense genomovar finnmarkense]MCG8723882.1 hypothetical protein [Tenacibaculum finnmarkense]MCG8742213.1 hypothetical protein [Tenacibaculum finnmarkense]MCG8765552.1 hypothetical protein [Tenacibaculum finnmarkense]